MADKPKVDETKVDGTKAPEPTLDTTPDVEAAPQPEPTPQPQVINVTLAQPNLAAEGARAMAEGRALEMDKCVPGGRYTVNGKTVDANGKELKGGE